MALTGLIKGVYRPARGPGPSGPYDVFSPSGPLTDTRMGVKPSTSEDRGASRLDM